MEAENTVKTPTEAENTVKRWYGAVGAGEWDAMRKLMTPDFKNHYPPSFEDEPLGREELIEFFKHFEWQLRIRDIFSDGNKVAVRVTITSKQVRELEGMPPSDDEMSVEGTVIWRVEDGQVAEAWAFPDTHALMQQMGLTFPGILWRLPRILWNKLRSRT